VDVAANLIIDHGNEGLAVEHMSQADPEEQSILINALGAESRNMKWIGNKGLGKHGYRGVQSVRRIFLNAKRHIASARLTSL
jgi:hypothetical protein